VLFINRHRWSSAGVVAALLLAAVSPLVAQSPIGSIAGTVTDASGRALGGVLVMLDEARGGAATERDGTYRLTRVPAGPHRVTFRYLGFAPQTISVTVRAGETVSQNVKMVTSAANLAAVLVTGQVAGQAAALNQQRAAGNISSVIDNELVGRLPDPNLAEALARVPGVAVVRDQGEGRFVQIRGTAGELNSMSLNGLRISTPEQSTRQLPMDLIPSDQAAAIQVSKTLTPDMDADAIGGNVNVVTRTARANRPIANFTAAGGQNTLGGGALVNLGANVGKRFGASQKFGAMFGGTYYRNDRASQNIEGDWCSQTRNCGVAPSLTSLDAPNLFELRDYPQVNRLRQGANGTLDYMLGNNSKVFLRGTYNSFSDDELRFRTRFGFRGGSGSRWTQVSPDSGTVTGARMDRDARIRKVTQEIITAQVGGEHFASNGLAFDWALGTSRASEERPDVQTMAFRQTGMTLAYNFVDPERPRANVVVGAFDDPTRFNFNSLNRETRNTKDDDVSAKLNLTVPVSIGTIKMGFAARLKDRENVLNIRAFTNALGTNSANATAATLFSNLVTETTGRTLFAGDYRFGRTLNTDRVAAFIAGNPGAFTLDQAGSTLASQGGTYSVGEDVLAGYVMGTFDFGALRLIPGMRVEQTSTNNSAGRVTQAGSVVTVTPVRGSTNYTNAFPSLNATYRVDELTNVRAAFTTALVRPQFRDMTPYVNIVAGQQTASIGNPDLNATTAIAYDVMVERYFRGVGFASAGAFYKDLSNYIFTTSRARLPEDLLGPDATQVTQPQNGPTAKLYGFEVAWQQNLTFLPGPLAGFGLNANYTYTKSEATLPSRPGTTSALPGQTGNAGNLGVFYDRGRFSLRVGGNFSGEFLSTINPVTPEGDTRTRARLQWDASGSVQLSRGVKFFAEAINLTNTPLRATVGNRDNRGGGGDDPSYEFYRPWGMAGFRIER
jgi:TonB-dependent receptor